MSCEISHSAWESTEEMGGPDLAAKKVKKVPDRVIGRLSLYRRLLERLLDTGVKNIFSHQLAGAAAVSAAQVRHDLMTIGYASGNSKKGYDVARLIQSIGRFLGADRNMGICLVGVGNLGRAIMARYARPQGLPAIVAAFDSDPQRVGRVIHGCRCHHMDELDTVVSESNVHVAIITVPASGAQDVADRLVRAGVSGILNFAPVPLRVPANVYVEDVDMTKSLERVAFFVRQSRRGARAK